MIHNLRFYTNPDSKKPFLQFELITEVGKCICIVHLDDKDPNGRPKLYADCYEVLGEVYMPKRNINIDTMDRMFKEGIRRIGSAVQQVCDDNGWNCWSY